MVVDDEPLIRAVFRRWLGRAGHDVVEAGSGSEALATLRAHPGDVDLVITDGSMPGGSGDELIAVIRATWPAMPVVCVTAYADDVILPVPVLAKPVSGRALLEAVASALAVSPVAPPPVAVADGGGAGGQVRTVAAQLEVLLDAMDAFAGTAADYQPMIDTLVGRISDALGGYCGIALLSDDGAWLDSIALYDPDPAAQAVLRQALTSQRMPVSAPWPGAQAVRSGECVLIPEVDPELVRGRVRPEDQPAMLALAIKSLLFAPLRARGRTLGVMVIGRRGSDAAALGKTDLRLAQSLADQAALAIANARLLTDERRMSDRLRMVTTAAQEFAAATVDLGELRDRIARRLCAVIGDGCAIRMVSEDGQHVEADGTVCHNDPELAAIARAALLVGPQRLGDGIMGLVAATGRSLFVPVVDREQLLAHAVPERRPFITRLAIASLIAVPLLASGRTIGIIMLVRAADRPAYTDGDLRLVEELATHAALALSNSRLLAVARRELAERLRAEEALRVTEEQLRQAQKMEAVGRLAGGVAHDFNNLLSVVLSYSELLMGDLPADSSMRDDVEQIHRAGERATDLTRQLLAFSRRQILQPRVLALDEVVAGMERMIRRLVGEAIAVRSVTAPGLGAIKADRGHIEQVIMNLAVNARDAMLDGGTLTIETSNLELDETHAARHLGLLPGPHVVFALSDTGIGMDPATLARIFEPFFTTKAPDKGTGLGLSTVFGIVKQSGGAIDVSSQPGRGTTFTVYLPRTDDVELAVPVPAGDTTGRGCETILVVEDDAQLRGVASGILRRNGYQVLEASSGSDAIVVCQAYQRGIDLLLTDVVMPHMNGSELANQLGALRPAMRVLYMSGHTAHAIQHLELDPSIALLQKPLTPATVLRAVRGVLDRSVDPMR